MASKKKEAQARIKINKHLEAAGWRFFETPEGPANVLLEENVRFTHKVLEDLGDDFQNAPRGAADYLLTDARGFNLCVLEAKKESIHPLTAKEQARDYAKAKNTRFVILSNGNAHYLWDTKGGNPEMITEFPTQESLAHRADYAPNTLELAQAAVGADFLAPAKTLRNYQVAAIKSIQSAASQGKTRYLFEMATGTGKTTTAGAICKLFISTGNAKRVLFLVDRIELEDQTVKALGKEIFKDVYFVGTVKSGDWRKCKIVVSTIQTLMVGDRYKQLFSPTDFELVISDEAHRSIGGNSRAVFEYFIGYKLGLTATPKDYLKGVDKEAPENSTAMELRQLRDTYRTFGCEAGEPTYRYDLAAGVKDGFLINPLPIDARTDVTTQLLSDEGYAVEVTDDDGAASEESFGIRDFERKFFNEDTNRVFAQAILDNGLSDPITGEFGKTLVFCVSQSHAAKMADWLNKLAAKKWPGKYDSDFALQVTSSVADAQEFTKAFSNNKLRGKSKFAQDTHPDYDTGRTRICVTVGMMTTGYDCPDLLNVALLRPVFSPADFVQMKGRGTRTHTFKYAETGEVAKKDKFALLDFFGNCEYFEKDFDYAKKLDLPRLASREDKPTVVVETPKVKPGTANPEVADKLDTIVSIQIGDECMRIDRELYRKPHEQFEQVLQKSERVKGAYQRAGVDGVVDLLKNEVFNKPTEYWTPQSIAASYEKEWQTQRNLPIREVVAKALGELDGFASRADRLEDEWQKFMATERPVALGTDLAEVSRQLEALKDIFEAYLSDAEVRRLVKSGLFAELEGTSLVTMAEVARAGGQNIDRIKQYTEAYLAREMKEFEIAA